MDVHPPKNGMYRYWSIPILLSRYTEQWLLNLPHRMSNPPLGLGRSQPLLGWKNWLETVFFGNLIDGFPVYRCSLNPSLGFLFPWVCRSFGVLSLELPIDSPKCQNVPPWYPSHLVEKIHHPISVAGEIPFFAQKPYCWSPFCCWLKLSFCQCCPISSHVTGKFPWSIGQNPWFISNVVNLIP